MKMMYSYRWKHRLNEAVDGRYLRCSKGPGFTVALLEQPDGLVMRVPLHGRTEDGETTEASMRAVPAGSHVELRRTGIFVDPARNGPPFARYRLSCVPQ